jgi:hypothetical protein
MFYGLIVRMYFKDHFPPHIHVEYQDDEALVNILTGEITKGSLLPRHLKLIQAWVEIHQEDLMANWKLCINGEDPQKIDPLR